MERTKNKFISALADQIPSWNNCSDFEKIRYIETLFNQKIEKIMKDTYIYNYVDFIFLKREIKNINSDTAISIMNSSLESCIEKVFLATDIEDVSKNSELLYFCSSYFPIIDILIDRVMPRITRSKAAWLCYRRARTEEAKSEILSEILNRFYPEKHDQEELIIRMLEKNRIGCLKVYAISKENYDGNVLLEKLLMKILRDIFSGGPHLSHEKVITGLRVTEQDLLIVISNLYIKSKRKDRPKILKLHSLFFERDLYEKEYQKDFFNNIKKIGNDFYQEFITNLKEEIYSVVQAEKVNSDNLRKLHQLINNLSGVITKLEKEDLLELVGFSYLIKIEDGNLERTKRALGLLSVNKNLSRLYFEDVKKIALREQDKRILQLIAKIENTE